MRETGNRGEQVALQYLLKKGYRHLKSNYGCYYGEIDMIVYNDRYIVFVEVKMRKDRTFGHPLEMVTASKKRKIQKTAEFWLAENPKTTLQPRIDVIAIDAPGGGFENLHISHIENAF